jgi:hypothetical protein
MKSDKKYVTALFRGTDDTKSMETEKMRAFVELPDEVIRDFTKAHEPDPTTGLRNKTAVDALRTAHENDYTSIRNAISAVGITVAVVTKSGDTLDGLATDLVTAEVLQPSESTRFIEKARIVVAGAPSFNELAVRFTSREFLSVVLNELTGSKTRCALLPEFDKEYNAASDDPAAYSPTVTSLYPRILATLDLRTGGKERHVTFALGRPEARELINQLRLALVQLQAVESYTTKNK